MHYGTLVDLRKCVGCNACTVACQIENELPLNMKYTRVLTTPTEGVYPNVTRYNMPVPCQHCNEAPCIEGCPTGASYRTEDGIVLVNPDKCVGCKFCMVVCPYEARVFNRETGVVQKCKLCTERLHYVTAKGKSKPKPPRCVEVCHMKCRYYGDLDDPNSEISQMIKAFNAKPLKEEAGTKPSMYYIFPDENNKIGKL